MTEGFDDPASWLRNTLLPHWLIHARHPAGGFVDMVDPISGPDLLASRSLLVQARLAYGFAATEGRPEFLDAALDAMALIDRAFTHPEGGYGKAIDATGRPIDLTRDFYDMTFVILASAWLYRRTGDVGHIARIDRTLHFLGSRMAHPAGGWQEVAGETVLPRRQNPHMHLLEGLLAAFEATGRSTYLDRASDIVDLFLLRFFDSETDSLIEFMDDHLAPLAGAAGLWREPGHHFEWTWLLLEYARLTRTTIVQPFARRLYHSALRHGLADTACGPQVIEAVDPRGGVLSPDRLLWPQTEYVKAEVAIALLDGDPAALARAKSHLARFRRSHFGPDGVSWRNRIAPGPGRPPGPMPLRVLYHVVCAVHVLDDAMRQAQPGHGVLPAS